MTTSVLAALIFGIAGWPDEGALHSQSAPEATARAAFLFSYRPKPGKQALFDEGYRRHLTWHARMKDPLVWYAWYVTTGDRLGLFIDGSFGASFDAFDKRVDPEADAADFAQTAGDFADDVSRSVYRLRPDLSTSQALEDRAPTSTIEVTYFLLEPGHERQFEAALAGLRAADASPSAGPHYTWYQLVVGDEQPSYMLMIHRQGWSDYGHVGTEISHIPGIVSGEQGARELENTLEQSVRRMWSETWNYRDDLSLVPEG
ncbi:MAG: hypothetical protein GEU99_06140 [Luteitalea sp.]|nr:hypothetical protein [Luteitalea sp.]